MANPRESAATVLRRIISTPGCHQGPACFDALSAKLIESAGFSYCITSGFSISATRLGLPDAGFISYGEILDQGRLVTQAVNIPVIGDADNGYGNSMNVKRTVKGFIHAGFAGILLEDQMSPKACGLTRGRKVVSREEAVMRIKAAVDARSESGSDIVIVARSDARQGVSLEEALVRTKLFADAGADVCFIDALGSVEEMKAFCQVAPRVPKLANMLERGGKTPILNPQELDQVGYKLAVYPLSLMGVSIRAMQAKWYYYILLGLVDVEANFLVVKAYQYTSLTSVMLPDCWSIPCVMLLTWIFLKTKYRFKKITGVIVCIAGLVLVVFSDVHAGDRAEVSETRINTLLMLLKNLLQSDRTRKPVQQIIAKEMWLGAQKPG
ncbi:2,3-dimethylmalate lyase isoform X1 [Medicago truncatula]|uniref:2,3-dimethylmalate lyase isoform X1 n=1 Tax=Medicago truncatula TaxID=3880 RepID=UPI000D2F45E7|nr:2,3-dimethylmalate lyase isoform X1 [Medicago truncatula]XP_039684148.1 2,3-dimethylmalate lyase isoform X1 [Medicago truncatula]